MFATLALASLALQTPASCCDPMAAFAADPAFIASHLAPLPMRFKAREGKSVDFPATDGKSASGFYVAPSGAGKASVVMIHEWWGLNDYIRREAERLHNATGYGVLAVDLYDGKVATSAQEASQLVRSADPKRSHAIVDGAVATLKNGTLGSKAPRVGTIGWCFGGGWSLQTAIDAGKAVNACVVYYGMPEKDPARLKMIQAPVFMVWAKQDPNINAEVVATFESQMKALKKPVTTQGYDAVHAFANPSNPKYDKAAAEDAWSKTLAFYKRTLK